MMDERGLFKMFSQVGRIPCPYTKEYRCPACRKQFEKHMFGSMAIMWVWIGTDGKLYCSELHAKIGAPQ